MHEETRRRLIRAGFVIMCVVPTLTVLAWAVLRTTPLARHRIEAELSQTLGWQVSIDRFTRLQPSRFRLAGVRIVDPETAVSLAVVHHIDVRMTEQGCQLMMDQVFVPASALARWGRRAEERLLADDAIANRFAQLHIDQLTIEPLPTLTDTSPLVLFDLDWSRGRRPDVQRSRLFCALQSDSHERAIRMEIHRDRSEGSPVTRVELDTGSESIPLATVAAACGQHWSTEAKLSGRLPLVWRNGRVEGRFVGELSNIDLSDFGNDWIPHNVAGQAVLHLDACRFDAQGLQSLEGWVEVRSLEAPDKLIQSLAKLRLLVPGPDYMASVQGDRFSSDRFSVSVSLSEMGLICKGLRHEEGRSIAAESGRGIQLFSQGHVRVSYLICALIPDSADAGNVYQARGRLMRALPPTLPRMQF